VAERAAPALGDRRAHHLVDPLGRHRVAVAEGGDPLAERAVSRHQLLDLRQHRLVARERPQLELDPEEGARLVAERQPHAADVIDAGAGGLEVRLEVAATPARQRIERGLVDRRHRGDQAVGLGGQLGERARPGARLLGPLRRAVVGVDVALLVGADVQREADVVRRDGAERILGRRPGPGGAGAGDETEAGEGEGGEARRGAGASAGR